MPSVTVMFALKCLRLLVVLVSFQVPIKVGRVTPSTQIGIASFYTRVLLIVGMSSVRHRLRE